MRIVLASTCAMVVTALAGTAGAAQPLTQPSSPTSDIAGFTGGERTLPRIIEHVQHATGARVIDARYSRRGGQDGFDVLATKGGQLQYLRLARPDGPLQVIRAEDRPAWMLSPGRRHDLAVARAARVPLDQAVIAAERASGAPAVAAGLAPLSASLSSIHAYNVLVDYPGGHTRRIAVDDDSGMVISDPGVLGG